MRLSANAAYHEVLTNSSTANLVDITTDDYVLYNESQSLPMSAKNDCYKSSQEQDGIYQSLDNLTSESNSSEGKLTEEIPEIPHQDDKNQEPHYY